MTASLIPSFDEIKKATEQLRKRVIKTPLIPAPMLAGQLEAREVAIKAESMQWTGSFKVRGALWRCLQLTEIERKNGVVAYSSGNFAQGLAAAANLLGIPATIVMPMDAPRIKRQKTEAYGAEVVLSDHGSRPREEVAGETARELARNKKMTLLHPFDDPLIITGHASAALEAIEELQRTGEPLPDMVLCSAGGGGFSAGLALGFHYLCPEVEMVLVEPEGYESFGASLAAKQVSRVSSAQNTICDALQATAPGKAPFACAQYAGVHSTLAVQDHSILQAMQFAFDHLKMVIEPSGAGAIAALLQHCDRFQGKRVLAFTTGGNIALEDFARHLLDNPEDEGE